MARKETIVTLQDRDRELSFKIREMPATRLESWIIRALLLIAGSGKGVPEGTDIRAAGYFLAEKGLAALGSLDFDQARPLLDDLLGCCSLVIDKLEKRLTPEIADDHIEDVRTIFALRLEALKLNLGFLGPEAGRLSGFPVKPGTEAR
ncbi:MAG: hypothetical protein LBP61_08890 [Desulfovibrio sp.]|jgi:hypothetical protein|nr:hypothetical protein [Desulfovibrio sp.]